MKKAKIVDPKEQLIDQLLDQLLVDYTGKNPEHITAQDGLLKTLTKRVVERAMQREMDEHLGYEKHSGSGDNSGNSRNGHSSKTLITDQGDITISTPRDREGSFEPVIVVKGQRRWTGFDDKIISMYSLGMTTRDIQAHLKEIYAVNVDASLISSVTDAIMEDVRQWQQRPLDGVYPIIYLDALRVKVRDEGHVRNKAAHLVVGVNMEGKKELLGIWLEQNEGAKLWLKVVTDLKNRGVNDVFIACVDGLTGFPKAINAIFPETEVQRCIVHMIRNSLRYVSYKDRRAVVADLKPVYTAVNEESAREGLAEFGVKWDQRYPTIRQLWENNWEGVRPFFAYPPDIRKAIYTTNAIESINMTTRKMIKNRASFPTDDAAEKMLYLAIMRAAEKWTQPVRDWGSAMNQFAILFGDRVPLYSGSASSLPRKAGLGR
jgi:transposase-like protein